MPPAVVAVYNRSYFARITLLKVVEPGVLRQKRAHIEKENPRSQVDGLAMCRG